MKALIVDDERLARLELRRLLAAHGGVEIVAEARNGMEAREAVEQLEPELMFLDIEMPGSSGLQLLEEMAEPPQTIFTTAYTDHALRAIELNAVDYLLKPVSAPRLAEALERVRQRMQALSVGPSEAGTATNATVPPMRQFFLHDGDQCWLVAPREIRLFRSEGNYTRVFFGEHQPLIYRPLVRIEERLDASVFFRANRSEVINLQWVQSIAPEGDGLCVTLRGGPEIAVSRRQTRLWKERLEL